MKLVKLYTYQSKRQVNRLLKDGVLKVTQKELKHTLPYSWENISFHIAYAYIMDRMDKLLPVKKDESILSPIWAWYLYDGKRKPTKENDKCNKRMCRITFVVDLDDVLLTDFDIFSEFVASSYNPTDQKAYDTLLKYCLERANKTFDMKDRCLIDKTKLDTMSRHDRCIQATLWEIRLDQVKDITYL